MSLSSDLRKIRMKKGLAGATTKVVKASLWRVFGETESPSPVDKGYFKGGWFFAEGTPNKKINDDPTRNSMGDLKVKLASFRVGSVVYFTNNMPYSIFLEDGGSWQARDGMVKVAARNWKSIVADEVKKASK